MPYLPHPKHLGGSSRSRADKLRRTRGVLAAFTKGISSAMVNTIPSRPLRQRGESSLKHLLIGAPFTFKYFNDLWNNDSRQLPILILLEV